jgi:hypothetical protein
MLKWNAFGIFGDCPTLARWYVLGVDVHCYRKTKTDFLHRSSISMALRNETKGVPTGTPFPLC